MYYILLSLMIVGSELAKEPTPPTPSGPELGRRMLNVCNGIPFQVQWKAGVRSPSPAQDKISQDWNRVLEDAPDGGTILDPHDEKTILINERGFLIANGSNAFRKESWPVGIRLPAETPKLVEIWTPEYLCELDGAQSDHGLLYKLLFVPPNEQLKARQNFLSTFESQRATLGYVTNVHYVGQLLDGLADIDIQSRTDGLLDVRSPSFKFEATIDPGDGRLIGASFENPTGRGNTYTCTLEFGGWYSDKGLGFAHPAWARTTYIHDGEPTSTSVTLYDLPELRTHVGDITFDWRTTAESVYDMNNQDMLHADGSRSPKRARGAVAIPVADPVEVSPQGLLRLKDPATPNRYVWAVGITLIAAGAALWIRNRFMTRK